MADFTVRFNDWKGGDAGIKDPSRWDSDQFSAENMTIYGSGLIGPRAGIKRLSVSGLPDHTSLPGPWGFTAHNNTLLVVLDDRIYQIPEDGGHATAWAPYPATVMTPVRFAVGNRTVYSLVDGVLYKHDGVTSTTAIDTPAPLSDIIRWNVYMVGVDRNVPWRIWFNTADESGTNFDLWDSGDYIDVGNNDPITTLEPILNTLYIGKREGWWAVSGVLGILASQRDVVIGNGPLDSRCSSVTTDQRVVYWPVDNVPAFFNGERVGLEPDHEMSPRRTEVIPGDCVIVTPTARRLLLAGDDNAGGTKVWAWQNGVWLHHRAAVELGAFAPGEVRQGSDLPNDVVYAVRRPGTIGDPATIVAIQHETNRPAHRDDNYASPLDFDDRDLITGRLSTWAWYDGLARQCRVRWAVVQFRKWPSGVADTMNRMTMRVDALGPYGAGRETSAPETWLEPSERAPRAGADDSWRVNVGEQGWGNGFQIHFDEVAGVAIREVIVGVNVRTERL